MASVGCVLQCTSQSHKNTFLGVPTSQWKQISEHKKWNKSTIQTSFFPPQFCPMTVCHRNRKMVWVEVFFFRPKKTIKPLLFGFKEKVMPTTNKFWFCGVLCFGFFFLIVKEHQPNWVVALSRMSPPTSQHKMRRLNIPALITHVTIRNFLGKKHPKKKKPATFYPT